MRQHSPGLQVKHVIPDWMLSIGCWPKLLRFCITINIPTAKSMQSATYPRLYWWISWTVSWFGCSISIFFCKFIISSNDCKLGRVKFMGNGWIADNLWLLNSLLMFRCGIMDCSYVVEYVLRAAISMVLCLIIQFCRTGNISLPTMYDPRSKRCHAMELKLAPLVWSWQCTECSCCLVAYYTVCRKKTFLHNMKNHHCKNHSLVRSL